MLVVIQPDQNTVAQYAYGLVKQKMQNSLRFVLGLATGSTPLLLYRELIEGYKRKELDFSNVHTFNLDEYFGLAPDNLQSYYYFMRRNFFDHINIKTENVNFLSGLTDNIEKHCKEYEQKMQDLGKINLQILGIGRDGHIGFNEPVSSLGSRTRDKVLSPSTVKDNKRFFKNEAEVPRKALTMGVGTILEAESILVLATGTQKAKAVASMIEGPVTSMCTASALQMHPRVTVVCDDKAALELRNKEYYKWVFEHDH